MMKDQTRRHRSVKQQSDSKPSSRDHRATAYALFTEAEQARYDHAQALTWAAQDFASLERDVVELCRSALTLWERLGALGERYRAHSLAAAHMLDLLRDDYAHVARDDDDANACVAHGVHGVHGADGAHDNEPGAKPGGSLARECLAPYGLGVATPIRLAS